jgi:hypothetical protein
MIYKARGIDNSKHDIEFEIKEEFVEVTLNSLTGIEAFTKVDFRDWIEITKAMKERLENQLKEKI